MGGGKGYFWVGGRRKEEKGAFWGRGLVIVIPCLHYVTHTDAVGYYPFYVGCFLLRPYQPRTPGKTGIIDKSLKLCLIIHNS